ncbi:uncharacterized protein BJ212DRAFT_1477287 [Suillus subaureus]|uniref:Uncharacterized protein n=1 Tax=Suillus subaureus TaxID=48587 RepID=A0A9P7EIK8_9AGAM|nr:uncharacterized protein BJ212DRAFT_1477287 [Suillus subaureus]KAG1822878.1 hypothetical protein BJ212DRAFT_1477287 [Suillus subaureus]
MPALRLSPHRRRSARLQALQTLSQRSKKTVEKMQGPIVRGRGGKARYTSMGPGSLKVASRRSSRSKPALVASASSAPPSRSTMSPANSSPAINEEIENTQSDVITEEELRSECYMAKYHLTEQVNQHRFLKAERAIDHAEAAAAHKRAPEAKDSEIRLCEAETKVHNALARAHAEEAVTLRLKIEYARLTSSSSGS